MIALSIDTEKLIILANKLERIHKSAFPVAVRGSLNNAAFDVKQNTMLRTSKEKFTNRQANFFKANSKVDMASGFDVDSMRATVGFVSTSLKGGSNNAVKDLEQQERGGTIKSKSFIPMRQARMSSSDVKNVRPSNRISGIKKIINAKNKIKPAAFKAGVGGHILGVRTLFRVDSLSKGGFKLTPLYSFKKSRTIQVKATNFMSTASSWSGRKIEKFFVSQAEKQFSKI